MFDFTVVIPTYNGADKLPQLLSKLRSQTNTDHFTWSILIVDNNSSDDTAAVVQRHQAAWNQPWPLEYTFESQQGAAFARQKGIRLAQSEIIGCIDDDNLPEPSWVANAYGFAQDHPGAGAFGGRVQGSIQGEIPENFSEIESVLALRNRGDKPEQYRPDVLDLPPAAAVVIRKSAWMAHVPAHPLLGGRGQGSMMQGDDYEPLLYMYKAGWEIWYAPSLITYHQIPQKRLERDYLIDLSRGCGLCNCHLRMILASGWQKPLLIARILFGSDLRILLSHFFEYRRQLKTELVPACKMALYWANWQSPFYFIRDRVKQQFRPPADRQSPHDRPRMQRSYPYSQETIT